MSGTVPPPTVLRRRMRDLTYLAIATGVAVLLAILAVWLRASSVEPAFRHQLMFPGLRDKLNDVATIVIESKNSAFSITRTADGHWVLPGKSSYPANVEQVRNTVISLGDLEAVDQRTARPDWHERLGLGAPKSGGSGVLVTLKDSQGKVLASLITGQPVEGVAGGGKTAVYVRRGDDNQTYVALGNYTAQSDQTQWLDKTFVDLTRDSVKTVSVKPLKGPPFTVTRAKPEDQNFTVVEALPRGRVLRTEAEPNGVGNSLVSVLFDDVARADTLDFSHAAHASYQTFDGVTYNVAVIEKDRDFWITLNAEASPTPAAPAPTPAPTAPPKPGAPATPAPATPAPAAPNPADVAKKVDAVNHMTSGWAYKVPRYKGVLINASLEDLLKPVGGPPPGPDATPGTPPGLPPGLIPQPH